ncbi:MAG: acyl-CoA dehydrogenase [Rhodospirillaceae bacterium TMED8]|nr:MAG: acyl-CoA dehydrogenase [Rhodospirillaceae bacterium TMED8]
MDFNLTEDQLNLQTRTKTFVENVIIPFEKDPRCTSHGPTDELRLELNALAKEAGLFAPHVSEEWGGLGLDHRDMAVVFEAAGYSPLGPIALHCAAPDEGNMNLLAKVATPYQQDIYLRPLAAGETRSCFTMTEPSGGAGSDPNMLTTTAVPSGNHYVINGRKWLITGAKGAAFTIIMAVVPEGHSMQSGPTMFLAPMDSNGIEIKRNLDTMDSSFTGGHAEVEFKNLRLPADSVLGEVGEAFRYVQVRLAPARLTHCMRWLGGACRAHDIASKYAKTRHAFGKAIGHHEGIGFMLADNEIDLQQSRLMVWWTANELDSGRKARHESSMTKIAVSEALFRVADRSLQILGGMGMTSDTVVEQIFREVRGFRIYDGPSEVHRWAIARRILKREKLE